MAIPQKDYLNNLLNELCKFEEKIEMLSNKNYPSEVLINLLNEDIKIIVNKFKDIIYNELEDEASNEIRDEAILVAKIWSLGYLQQIAKAVSNTHFRAHPLEIMNVFRDTIKEIEDNDFEILTIPTETMNFSFSEIWISLKKFIENNFDINKLNVNKKLISLSFPEDHKDNLLLAGIFFHEIGHYLENENNLADKIFTSIDFQTKEFNNLKNYITFQDGTDVSQIDLVKVMQNKYLISWVKELISDSIATYMIGPAFIFSMMDFVTTNSVENLLSQGKLLDNLSTTHPRFYIRFQLILKIIRENNLYEKLPEAIKQKLIKYEESWNNATVSSKTIHRSINVNTRTYIINENNNFFNILETIVVQAFSKIMNETKILLESNIIRMNELEIAQNIAEKRLKQVIPPNELNNCAVNPVSIINSGWYAKILFGDHLIKKLGNLDNKKGDYDLNILINDLLKYSLKASRIQRRWQK